MRMMIPASELPTEAANVGGHYLDCFIRLYALANGVRGEFRYSRTANGDVQIIQPRRGKQYRNPSSWKPGERGERQERRRGY